jgi:hypothetical protein
MDIVDPQEDGKAGERPLLERLLGASQKVVKFLTEAPVACTARLRFKKQVLIFLVYIFLFDVSTYMCLN